MLLTRLRRDSENMQTKFAMLLDDLRKSMKRITVQELTATLLMQTAFKKLKKQSAFENHREQLMQATSVDEVFITVIRDCCTFIKFDVIEFLIERLGSEYDKAKLANYKESFKDYAKRRAIECPSKCRECKSSEANMVIKLDSTLEEHTLETLQDFHQDVCKILEISPLVLQLCCVRKGCIRITYQIPGFVARAIFPLSPKQESDFKHFGAILLSCGDYCFEPKV